jgi:primosomal protein N' (replication factor Y)
VPAVATFAVDDGFSYAVPPTLEVEVGSIVRVPLSGRTVRGWVTGLREGDGRKLREVSRVSGAAGVFDDRLLRTLRWAAIHYVAPLPVLLKKAMPPNLPLASSPVHYSPVPDESRTRPPSFVQAAARGGHHRSVHLLEAVDESLDVVAPVLASDRSVMIVFNTAHEATAAADSLRPELGNRVMVAGSHVPAKEATRAWSQAAVHPGTCLVGTREICFWSVAGLGLAIVVGDGRRGLKDKQTPTLHARTILQQRSRIERFGLVTTGPVPATEVLGSGAEVFRSGRTTRIWPLVEVVDRGEEPPGSGVVTGRALAAIRTAVAVGGKAFVFCHRRSPAYRCTACLAIRRCRSCGSGAFEGTSCSRCGHSNEACSDCSGERFELLGAAVPRVLAELQRLTGNAGPVGSGSPIEVGSERDLPLVQDQAVAVIVDADGLIFAPTYRADEDALRLLARVAATVARGRGHRCLVQTAVPTNRVIEAFRHGDPIKFLEEELESRAADRLPPVGEIIILEATGAGADPAEVADLVSGRADLYGPAPAAGGLRWLIQGPDLRNVRIGLRRLVHQWRERRVKVRVDADPLDL